MKSENNNSITNIAGYLMSRKFIFFSVACCFVGLILLITGMFVCDKSFWNYMFVWILPGTGMVLLGTYAIAMTDKHPIILIFPPIIFFASLFIRYLVTYEYLVFFFLLLQSVPFVIFWINILKKNLFAETRYAVTAAIISVLCMLLAIIVVNFMDRFNIVSLPLCEHQQLEILAYVEIAIAGIYYALGFLNHDMEIAQIIKQQ